MVATTGEVPVLLALNAAMLPVPSAARPMLVVLLVQVYEVTPKVLFVVKSTALVIPPLHTTWFEGSFTWPAGLTVMVKLSAEPSQVTPS